MRAFPQISTNRQPSLNRRWWIGLLAVLAIGLLFLLDYFLVAEELRFDVGRDIGQRIDVWLNWLKHSLYPFFQVFVTISTWLLLAVQDLLYWLNWPAFIAAVTLISWSLVSSRLALFSLASLLVIVALGLWGSTVETLSLVFVTVTLSLLIALPVGVWSSQSDLLNALLRPILDAMQTMPAFVYLVPAVAFFSLGDTPAVLATLIAAVPPAVRLTNLGIRQLPTEALEVGESFGMTGRQSLLMVKIPMAYPTIMAGVNQSTLMAFSMVMIASLVGAGGLGLDVKQALGRIEPGNAFLGGFSIVFLAIIVDRMTEALASRRQRSWTLNQTGLLAMYARRPIMEVICASGLAAFSWVVAGIALADPNLSPGEALGGAKALLLVLAVLTTLRGMYTMRRFGDRA